MASSLNFYFQPWKFLNISCHIFKSIVPHISFFKILGVSSRNLRTLNDFKSSKLFNLLTVKIAAQQWIIQRDKFGGSRWATGTAAPPPPRCNISSEYTRKARMECLREGLRVKYNPIRLDWQWHASININKKKKLRLKVAAVRLPIYGFSETLLIYEYKEKTDVAPAFTVDINFDIYLVSKEKKLEKDDFFFESYCRLKLTSWLKLKAEKKSKRKLRIFLFYHIRHLVFSIDSNKINLFMIYN